MKHEIPPLQAAIEKAWSEAETNDEAVDALLAMMHADPALYRLAMQKHERRIAQDHIAGARSRQRSLAWNKPKRPMAADVLIGSLVTATTEISLLYFPLPSGRRLGEAERSEVIEAAKQYNAQARDMNAKALWLAAVAEAMPAGSVVKDVLTENDLENLRNA